MQGASRADAKTIDGKVHSVNGVLAEDREADLILLSVNITGSAITPLSASSAEPEIGERILVIGSPLGLERSVSDGIVSAVRDYPVFGKVIQITAPMSEGSSGGPVVNMKGKVIGVATFQKVKGQNLNFAVPIERVANLTPAEPKTLVEWRRGTLEEWLASAEGYHFKGLIFLWIEDHREALTQFEKAIEKQPHWAEAYFAAGYCNAMVGCYLAAIEHLKKAVQHKPHFVEAYINLGAAYAELGRYEEAMESYEHALRLDPNNADLHNNLGVVYGKLKLYEKEIEFYRRAVRLDANLVDTHINLGVVYGDIGCFEEALESYKQAVRIDPDNADAQYGVGWAYCNLGRVNEAVAPLQQAVHLKPDYGKAHLTLGEVYLTIGDRQSALEEYKILKDLDLVLANQLFGLIYK